MNQLTKQQQIAEAWKDYLAITDPAFNAYLAKLSEINAQEETL